MTRIPPEVVEQVRRLAAAGITDPEIGRIIGRSNRSVYYIREFHGITAGHTRVGGRPRAVEDEEIDEIAVERLMAGDPTVPLKVGPGLSHRLSVDAIEAIRRLARRGLNDTEISIRLHHRMSPEAVWKARHRNGIPNGLTGKLAAAS